ncbi:ClpP/crotonase-like domain-containing protein [Yarrowia lipolytica]|uniref:ClpP/crotonase-like domain-containing protein n=1 Tax=Yarrowia lipolytica TaxID=4952 RepID=A0A371C3K1_YARLL|nr:Enoyl-CoA delta isomerase 3 [Yarrowia lipolytica]RDW24891.1 ClpP/crotonase-like domain-containing protein [Yarrowia lipolytica]RDW31715.1 ClpP/crotonase-like domain-containing protein [Yarrowia lipolytica]RDW41402.1 ClpP/crotonase-like domain-containing protein [Yarrowia lipolytica]RDW48518.1 ClpP/crotonase-like domain-containing protein [Yarrowia lipolytica]
MSLKLPQSFPLGGPDQLVLVTEEPTYYVLKLNSPPDNRLTPELLTAWIEAMEALALYAEEPKPLVITSAMPKYFSNGLDLEATANVDNFTRDFYYPLIKTLLNFPWPTIGFLNGHTFAGAFVVAGFFDFRVMNPDRGYLCMNEIEFDAPIMGGGMVVFTKLYGRAVAQRITMLAERFPAQKALEAGIIHAKGMWPEVEQMVKKVSHVSGKKFYSLIRKEVMKDIIEALQDSDHQLFLDALMGDHIDPKIEEEQRKRLDPKIKALL